MDCVVRASRQYGASVQMSSNMSDFSPLAQCFRPVSLLERPNHPAQPPYRIFNYPILARGMHAAQSPFRTTHGEAW